MKNTIYLLLLILLSFSSLGQVESESLQEENQNYRVGISAKLFLIPQRSLFFPVSTYNSQFYTDNFGLVPAPSHRDRGVATVQTGGNFALTINPDNHRLEFEIGFDLGYQYSGEENDKIYSTVITNDTSYRYAEISVDYKLHELSTGTYFIIKSNNSFLNIYAGIGVGYYFLVGKAQVTNSILGNEIESYKTKFPKYSNLTPYIPIGLEIPLSQKKNDFYIKIMGSIRREVHNYNYRPNRLFLTGGMQLQYQF